MDNSFDLLNFVFECPTSVPWDKSLYHNTHNSRGNCHKSIRCPYNSEIPYDLLRVDTLSHFSIYFDSGSSFLFLKSPDNAMIQIQVHETCCNYNWSSCSISFCPPPAPGKGQGYQTIKGYCTKTLLSSFSDNSCSELDESGDT